MATCGCGDGLKATDDGSMVPKSRFPCLYGITVEDGKAKAHTEYYDVEEIVIDADGNASFREYD